MTSKTSKKDQLLEAGLEIFYTKGFEKATIDDIVNLANCGKGTFYRYFQSKDVLFDELEKRFRNTMMVELQKTCPYSLPVSEFIRSALHSFLKIFRINHRLGLVKMARDQETGRATCDYDKTPPGIAYVFDYLKSAASKGLLKDLKHEAIVSCLLGSVHFFIFRDFKLCIPVSEKELDDTVDIILNGVLPR